jgi:hypothetical protein
MPPSRNEQLCTKEIAKSFFNLDISDEGSSIASGTPKPRIRYPVTPQPRTPHINVSERGDRATFLTLPVELRLQIYDYLLVSRFDRTKCPSWAVANTYQKPVWFYTDLDPQTRTMEPSILRTCKQIHHEGNSILYSQNVFAIDEPEQLFQLVARTGLANFGLVRRLDIGVPCMSELPPWLELLSMLAENASGLRCVELTLGAMFGWECLSFRGTRDRGFGDSLEFVRALGKIDRIETLVIEGYYAKNWPAYLEERMGARVLATGGCCCKELELREGELNDEELKNAKYIRKRNEYELKAFEKYQLGTEDLIP